MILLIKNTIKKIINSKSSIIKKGDKVKIGANAIINDPKMLEIGNNCSIGPNAVIYCIYKKIILGNNVMIGPNVTMINGDHNIRKIGIPMINNHDKEPSDDAEIVIEDDVWIGANVTILKGVRIGRGAVIAAGTILTRSVLPYCIIAGVNKIINIRFDVKSVIEHEKNIYPESERFGEANLKHINQFIESKKCQNQD